MNFKNSNIVWDCDDLKREIFSYLRKEPKRKCHNCNAVCVWDKKVKDYVDCNFDPSKFKGKICCFDCYFKFYFSNIN